MTMDSNWHWNGADVRVQVSFQQQLSAAFRDIPAEPPRYYIFRFLLQLIVTQMLAAGLKTFTGRLNKTTEAAAAAAVAGAAAAAAAATSAVVSY